MLFVFTSRVSIELQIKALRRPPKTLSSNFSRYFVTGRTWEESFAQVKAHVDAHKNDKLLTYPEDEELRRWLFTQRYLSRTTVGKQVLSAERKEKIESLGYKSHDRDDNWDQKIEQLENFLAVHGCFPCDKKVSELRNPQDVSLYWWCLNQRKQYMNLQRNKPVPASFSEERQKQLEDMGFCWNANEFVWTTRWNELLEYYKVHGNCLVPADYPQNNSLAVWVGEQRYHYKKLHDGKQRQSSMTPERIKKLESIGFVWNVHDARWEERYRKLEQYCSLNGKGAIPHYQNDKSLHRWLKEQLKRYGQYLQGEETIMNEERASKLSKLGYVY